MLPPSFSALQQKRRDEALESQRAARQRQLALARNGTDTSAQVRRALDATAQDSGSSSLHFSTAPTAARACTGLQGSASAAAANVAQTVQPLLSASQHAAQDAPLSGAEAPTGPGEGSADAQMAAEPTSPSQSTGQSEHRKQRRSGARQKHRQRAAGGTQSGNAMDTEQAEDQQEGPADEHPRHYWSRQLQQPEWLTDVPADLSSAWYGIARSCAVQPLQAAIAQTRALVALAKIGDHLSGGHAWHTDVCVCVSRYLCVCVCRLVMPRPEGTRVSIVPTR